LASAGKLQHPLGGQPQRQHTGSVFHRRGRLGLECGAGAGLLEPGPATQRRSQRLGGGDQQRLELPAAIGGDLDRTSAGKLQHPQRLPLATLARDGQVLTAQGLPAGPDRVQRVALGAVTAPRALGPIDLDHPLALISQEAGQPGAVAAGALQPPAAPARRAFGDQAKQPDRGGMIIAVGVDPDDVVDLAF
jgi:hypothetical protein